MAIVPIDLLKRSEKSSALTAAEYDNNLDQIETAINSLINEVVLVYGDMYQIDATNTITIADTAWHKVTGFTAGVLKSVTFSSDGLVLPDAGDYYVEVSVSFSASVGNEVTFTLAIDGAADGRHKVARVTATTGDVGAASLAGIVSTTGLNQVLTLLVANSGSADVTIKHATVVVRKLGE